MKHFKTKSEASDSFFNHLTYYSDLMSKTLKTQEEQKKIDKFFLLRDYAKKIGQEIGMSGNEFMEYFHTIYVNRNTDDKIESWSFIQTFTYVIQNELEGLSGVN